MLSLQSQMEYIGKKFSKIVVESTQITDSLFSDSEFSNCSFRETTFQKCRFNNCVFVECDLSLINIEDSEFRDTIFQKSKVIGVNWTIARWQQFIFESPINFHECDISYSTFIGLPLPKIKFEDCIAKDVEFSETNLTDASFKGSTLTKSRFRKTDLTRANFEDALEYIIDVTKNKVTNARFSLPEAYSLVHNLGEIVLVES